MFVPLQAHHFELRNPFVQQLTGVRRLTSPASVPARAVCLAAPHQY
jgi:hypothetical protein